MKELGLEDPTKKSYQEAINFMDKSLESNMEPENLADNACLSAATGAGANASIGDT